MVKHSWLKTASVTAVAAVFIALPQSCVNEEYDITKIDKTVAFGGEELVFPLGSTEQLTLSKLLPKEDIDYLVTLSGGVYGFKLDGDPLDLSENIKDLDLASKLNIEAMDFSQEISEPVDIDLSGMSFGESQFPENPEDGKIDFGMQELPDVNRYIPAEPFGQSVNTGIYEYNPLITNPEQFNLNLGTYNIPTFEGIYDPSNLENLLPEVGDDEIVTIEDTWMPEKEFSLNDGNNGVNVSIHLEMDGRLSNVKVTELDENAAMKVTVTMNNSFLAEGEVIPEVSISNLDQIVQIDGMTGGRLDMSDLVLSAEKDKSTISVSRDYPITGLGELQWVLDESNPETPLLKTDKTVSINAEGAIRFSDHIATTRKMLASAGPVSMDIKVEFLNVEIEDMTMDIADISETEKTSVAVPFEPITLPQEVRSIESVTMSQASKLIIEISSSGLSGMAGLESGLHDLVISFPSREVIRFGEFNESGAVLDNVSNTLTVENVDLKSGRIMELPVEYVMPPLEGSDVDLQATVETGFTAGGSISLKTLPSTEEDDIKINFNVKPELAVTGYSVELDGIRHDITDIKTPVEINLPESVQDLGKLKVIPKQQMLITVNIAKPDLEILSDGLTISFPDMLVFKNTAQVENMYDCVFTEEGETVSMKFKNEIPSTIELEVDHLDIVPEKNPDGTGFIAGGDVVVSGSAYVPEGIIVGNDVIDALVKEGITVSGKIPGMDIDNCDINVETFNFQIGEQTRTVDIFDPASIQDNGEIKSLEIGKVQLADTGFNLEITPVALPDLDSDLQFELYITIPEEIKLEIPENSGITISDSPDGNGDRIMKLSGNLDKETGYTMPAVKVTSLDLSGHGNLIGADPVSKDIRIWGSLSAMNTTMTDPSGMKEDIKANVLASISNPEGQIKIDNITGHIDYRLDPAEEGEGGENNLEQTIDISKELPEFLKGEDMTLDFANPYIMVKVTSNVGIPVTGTLTLTPVYESGPGTAQVITIPIPKAEGTESLTETNLWIAGSEEGKPADYIYCHGDIASLLKKIPDQLELRIEAATDPEEEFMIEPSAEYQLGIGYQFVVPFEFGEDLNITMDYTYPSEPDESQEGQEGGEESTVQELPDELGELLNMNSLGLCGEIESSLPMELALSVDLLDSNHELIPTEPSMMTVRAGSEDKPSVSPLDIMLKLKEGADGTDLSYIRLNFTVTSGNMSGEPVTENSYMKATLKVKVPGGVTIDLSALGESENSEN